MFLAAVETGNSQYWLLTTYLIEIESEGDFVLYGFYQLY